jgi:hypothetical protein
MSATSASALPRRIRLDDVVGRIVRDAGGEAVGRLYDMRAEEQDGALVIVEYHIGSHALWERVGLSLRKLIGIQHMAEPRKVPWDQLDISNPENPVLLSRP